MYILKLFAKFQSTLFNPLTAKGFPIDKLNRLALDRVKSISAMGAPAAVKVFVCNIKL